MKASAIKPGDVWHDQNVAPFMVRAVRSHDEKRTSIRISAGRTDPGTWIELDEADDQDVYRPGE